MTTVLCPMRISEHIFLNAISIFNIRHINFMEKVNKLAARWKQSQEKVIKWTDEEGAQIIQWWN